MVHNDIFCTAKARRLHRTMPNTIRLWTIQPIHVWNALLEQGSMFVSHTHPQFADNLDFFRHPYDWMRRQMMERIPGYLGHYPWWAYEHFLDLRLYRWHTSPHEQRLVRLELAVPREQILPSSYGRWHWVLNRWYLPEGYDDEVTYEQEGDAWRAEAALDGVDVYHDNPYAKPWEARIQASWERIFDIEGRRPAEIIQATFERLEFKQVVKATEFLSMPEPENRIRQRKQTP